MFLGDFHIFPPKNIQFDHIRQETGSLLFVVQADNSGLS